MSNTKTPEEVFDERLKQKGLEFRSDLNPFDMFKLGIEYSAQQNLEYVKALKAAKEQIQYMAEELIHLAGINTVVHSTNETIKHIDSLIQNEGK